MSSHNLKDFNKSKVECFAINSNLIMPPWTESVKTFLNWTFAAFGSFLIIKEFYLYFQRPTNFEESSTKMDFLFLPNMVFCPDPAFDLETMQRLGYTGL